MNKELKKNLRDAAIFSFIIAAACETASLIPAVTIFSDRLNSYKNGNFTASLVKGHNLQGEKCLVAETGKTLEFSFNKSTSVSFFQDMFKDKAEPEILGTLPAYKIAGVSCDMIKDEFKKWNSLEEFQQDHLEAVQNISTNLKRVANEPDTTRFSTVQKLKR